MQIVNIGAVLVAALVSIILGFLWYGPLFGKAWIASMGWTPAQVEEGKREGMGGHTYVFMIIGSIAMAYVLGHAFAFASTVTGMYGIGAAFSAGFWNWIGFVAPVLLGGVLWEGKPWKWWCILSGYYLVSLVLMSVVFVLL